MKKFLTFCAAAIAAALFAAPIFCLEVPALTGPVMDTANIMSDSARAGLEEFLLSAEQNSSAQIVVLTIPSLNGAGLEDYSIKVAREWQLGSKEDSKGVLLLVAYKERKIRIEVGYGAEAELTDTKCGLIIRNIIAPAFKDGDYSSGIEKGVKAIASVLIPGGEEMPELKAPSYDDDEPSFVSMVCGIVFLALYILMFLGAFSSRKSVRGVGGRSSGYSGSSYRSSSRSSYHRSSYGGHGGGFGGGGASGGW